MGMSADPATVAGRLFERTILRGYATLCDELCETVAPIPREPTPPVEKKAAKDASFALTAFWDDFEKYKLAVREWKPDTAANARGTLTIFDRIFPGVTAAQLTAEPIATNFKSTLLQLPRHYSRGKRASTPIAHLIETAKNLPLADRIQKATVNKHLNNLLKYWDYLVSQKKLAADLKNPLGGLHMQKAKGKKAREERHNWPKSLEQQLFESPLYTGCASIHRRAKEGSIPYLEILDGKDSGSTRDVPLADLFLTWILWSSG
jgi:hypothetical protein